jgi:hypothetical protein
VSELTEHRWPDGEADTEQNTYREVLELDDSTRLEITAPPTDHNEQA